MIGGMYCPPVEVAASYRAGEMARISQPFHQGDGEDPIHHDIRYGAAGNGSKKGTGDNGGEPGSAGILAGKSIGKINEDFSRAGDLHERAEDDKYQDVGSESISDSPKIPPRAQKKAFRRSAKGRSQHGPGQGGK